MRFLFYSEARAMGLDPYAVYGGKVYSLRFGSNKAPGYEIVPHGSPRYSEYVAKADARLPPYPSTPGQADAQEGS